jgi:predicted DNA-binding transcriptional regulator AlpA
MNWKEQQYPVATKGAPVGITPPVNFIGGSVSPTPAVPVLSDPDGHPPKIGLVGAVSALAAILPRLIEVLERLFKLTPPVVPLQERLTLRIDELAKALGVSRRAIERERSAGRFPDPDLSIGKMPLWCVESFREWMAQQAQGRSVNP